MLSVMPDKDKVINGLLSVYGVMPNQLFSDTLALLREQSGWISVKDRLPKEKVWVLCLCRAGIREVLRWQNGQWYHDPQHAYFESFVLYWMPLPEPPEENGNEGD